MESEAGAAEAAQSNAEKLRGMGLAESGNAAPSLWRVLLVFVLVAGMAWGATTTRRSAYLFDQRNGATTLTVPVAHAISATAPSSRQTSREPSACTICSIPSRHQQPAGDLSS